MKPRFVLFVLGLLLLSLTITTRGSFAFSGPGDPSVIITSVGAAQFYVGQQITVQSTSTDPAGIARVDLLVDGTVVQSNQPPTPVSTLTLVQTWTAVIGSHTITVRVTNASNQSSDSAPISVTVVLYPSNIPQLATPTPTLVPPPTVPPTPGGAGGPVQFGQCTANAAFVADVTVPDGSLVNPGQAFIKTWRVQNTGTCAWDSTFLLAFVTGEAMTPWTAFLVPNTPPGATVDLPIQLTAPVTGGPHTGVWQLQTPNGLPFGPALSVVIQVTSSIPVAPPIPFAPGTCFGTPIIQFFNASSTTINLGESTSLNWGFVGNANFVSIDQGIGGVATPGSVSVSPSSTTTYTMTAVCGSNTAIAQVTITVNTGPTATPTITLTPIPAPPTATPSITPTRAPVTVSRCAFLSESGSVSNSGSVISTYQAGDDASNKSWRAFFSYNLSDLARRLIDSATLTIGPTGTRGNPFNLGTLNVDTVQYGTSLSASTYGTSGSRIVTINSGPGGQYNIRSAVQTFVNSAQPRFQLRFSLNSATNNNNVADMFTWANNTVCITITYR